MPKNGFTRELLREKGFTIVNGVAFRLPPPQVQSTEDGIPTTGIRPAPLTLTKAELDQIPAPAGAVRKRTRCEAALLARLVDMHPGAHIIPEFRVRISRWDAPAAVHYKADFAVFEHLPSGGWRTRFYEAKDSRRPHHSDELTRPKMALGENPWVESITLATWDGCSFTFRLIASQPSTTQPHQ